MDITANGAIEMPPRKEPSPITMPSIEAFTGGLPWWGKLILQTGAFGVVCLLLIWLTYDMSKQVGHDRMMYQQQLDLMRQESRGRTDKIEQIHERALQRIEKAADKTCESMDRATKEMSEATKAIRAVNPTP